MSDADLRSVARERSTGGNAPRGAIAQEIVLRPSYGVFLALYMAGITALSSIPRNPEPHRALVECGINFAHIPLFAGLAVLLIKTVSGNVQRRVPSWVYPAALLGLSAFAALDEWHQSFVPGRSASLGDLMLDTMGIGAVLLFYRLSELASEES
jgi:VanZ family protein